MKSIKLTKAQLAQSILQFKGKPYRLTGYEPFVDIYNNSSPLTVIQAGRQVSKSVTVGGLITTNAMATPYTTNVYIAPLSQQASRFSTLYLDPFLDSPLLKKHYRDTSSKKNVMEKSLNNGSVIFLSYAQDESDADRVRGIAGNSMYIDECQDASYEALPVLFEVLAAQENPQKFLTGTAKGEDNTLERYYKSTNRLEWSTKCPSCGHWNIPWNEEICVAMCAREEGPCCTKCNSLINVKDGKWLAAVPSEKEKIGFHIPQLIVPERVKNITTSDGVVVNKWGEIRDKLRDYPRPKWMNEVAGLAAGKGNRILSMSEAIACCDPNKKEWDTCWAQDYRGINNVVLGVDWSVSGSTDSYTVITVTGYDWSGKAYLMYSQRLQGVDILDQVTRVEQVFRQFNCQIMGSDKGVGVLQTQLLQQSLGVEKVVMVQYVSAKNHVRYDRQGGYLALDRTQAIDTTILKMKLGGTSFVTPCWELTQPFWRDALAVFEEESLSGKRLYRKDPSPDDWLHSLVFSHTSWMCLTGQYAYLEHLPEPS